MVGITNITQITMDNLTTIANLTTGDPIELFININQVIYGGWYWFVILCILWVILYFAGQDVKDQGLINFMYAGTVVSVISFIFRAINVIHNGVIWGFLTDFQMWVFPLLTILSAVIVYNTKSPYS
jgi:lipoprotein signal peptidase